LVCFAVGFRTPNKVRIPWTIRIDCAPDNVFMGIFFLGVV
jgi:hypothetical protein